VYQQDGFLLHIELHWAHTMTISNNRHDDMHSGLAGFQRECAKPTLSPLCRLTMTGTTSCKIHLRHYASLPAFWKRVWSHIVGQRIPRKRLPMHPNARLKRIHPVFVTH
jgi:hypothetical protein